MLSSRERVLMSSNHEKPDRAPVDIKVSLPETLTLELVQ